MTNIGEADYKSRSCHPPQLAEDSGKAIERQMLENFGAEGDVELRATDWYSVDGCENVWAQRGVDIQRGDVDSCQS